ncbi:hypothetical protein AB0J83_38725 [Actinoplanes sp. NPDC049596]|uniref:hypothetical protein n=1 Tax=unclassified Actinoplanes TaxID=2626549 RepID=UPI00343DC3C2
MTLTGLYLEPATSAGVLVAHPRVAERWATPSALARLRVGPLAAHLASQLTQVPPVLDAPVTHERLSLPDHFA